ncbi:MAG: TRAP transporter TatT component family protein [Pyrinomonadaceae bacterium]
MAGLAAIKEVRQAMETVLRLDESYQRQRLRRFWGRFTYRAPEMFGGDAQKAISTIERGLDFGKDNALPRLRLAEAYAADNRRGDARQQIDYILSMKPNPDYLPEHEEALNGAQQLKEKLAHT